MGIETLINEKSNWDKSPILVELLTEYVTSLSKISGLSEDFIIEKLSNQLDTLRIGDFKDTDSDIKYDGIPVTSEEFKDKYRKGENTFGAINISNEVGKSAICLFDGSNGLSGIDLNDIIDLKHTLYHELTHVLEKSIIKEENTVINNNGNYIVTGNIDPHKSIDDYLNNSSETQISSGLETIEFKQDGSRIMHNQISEGCTELISRMILEHNEITPPHKERYVENVAVAKLLFEQYGEDALKTYLTDSNKMVNHFLNTKVKDTNMLYFADNYIGFVNQMKDKLVSTDSANLSTIYANYVKYQSGEISAEELLNGNNENVNVVLRQIIDYKKPLQKNPHNNKLDDMLMDTNKVENEPIDSITAQRGNIGLFSIVLILFVSITFLLILFLIKK